MRKYLILFICLSVKESFSQFHYPPTKSTDSANTYFGVTYKDPYEWLENVKDTEVISWFQQQASYSKAILNTIAGRDSLIAEWKRLDRLQPARITGRNYKNNRLFYRKTKPGESIGKLYYREGMKGVEQLLFDPENYIKGKTLTIEEIRPSFDARYLAIAYSQQGAEVSTIIIMDMNTRKFLKESVFPVSSIDGWTLDNKAILYSSLRTADNADLTARLNTQAKLHIINTDTATDIDFFSNAKYPELKMEPKVYPYVLVTTDSKNYVFSVESTVQNEYVMYYAPITQFYSPKINWKVLCKTEDKLVRGMEFNGDTVFAISYEGAKNYKLLSTSLKSPDWKNAKLIAPEKKDQTLESITRTRNFLLLTYSNGINNRIYKYNLSTGITSEITLPYSGTAFVFCLNNKTDQFTAILTSWNKPLTEYEVNAGTNAFSPGYLNKPAVYPDAYLHLMVKEVEVKGHDGAMIPLSIIYKSGTKLDGNNICLMDGYGAYGISMTPYFDFKENSLVTRGAILAIPHVRGGSEKGEDWYKAGYKTSKPNTWKDFISCAEYLIEKGYTNPSKLAGTGTSAGGILISRSITERPDLFAAAICNVGSADAMREEFTMNGPVNIPEFGTIKDSIESRALYEMDGVQHVISGTKYPALICIGGWNDPRVIAWAPGKFAAAVQNASTSGKPVLLKINYDDGHFTEDKSVTFANFADQYAFAMWQCGHPDFQPK